MDVDGFIDAVRSEGELLLSAAASAGLEAGVPSCAGWVVRDLVRHVAGVHHWAAEQVGDQRVDEISGDLVDIVGGWPDDTDLLDWAAEQHRALVRVFETADRRFPYFTFLPGDTPFTMWVRRQAHETAIHRADAYRAAGWEPGFDAALAADGLDELLLAMIGDRPGPLPLDEPRAIHLIATDVDRAWTIVMSADGFTTHGERRGNADVTLRGPSDRLYLAAWHRREDGFDVQGDRSVLETWWANVKPAWS